MPDRTDTPTLSVAALRRGTVAVAVVGLIVSACGGDAGTAGSTRERLEILSESPTLEGELPFAEVAPREWEDAVVHGDGRTVTITYLGGTPACFGADHVEAVYEENHIILTVHDGVVRLEPNEGCPDIGITHSVTVRLSRPVRDLQLVDGAPGRHGP